MHNEVAAPGALGRVVRVGAGEHPDYPGGRIGEPEDIVALASFLCSDAASHLSGTVITVRPPVIPQTRQRTGPQVAASS